MATDFRGFGQAVGKFGCADVLKARPAVKQDRGEKRCVRGHPACQNAPRLWASREGLIEPPSVILDEWIAAAAMLQRRLRVE